MMYSKLQKAPLNHFSLEFLDHLRKDEKGRDVVIYEDVDWLVIENCKYHKKEAPWLTAFAKFPASEPWYKNARVLMEIWGDWKWIKKAASKQTVRRFHIHLIKE